MKKCLLLCLVIVATSHVFAATSIQGKWRWRKDDGTETTATYLAAENTTPTIAIYDNIRVRVEAYNNNSGGDIDISTTKLSYSKTGNTGPWILISDTVANKDFVLAASASVADGTPTTQQLTARSGYTFKPGRVISTPVTFAFSLPNNQATEFEFVIKPTTTATLSATYYFETTVGSYDQPLPSLTTAAVLPVNLLSFGVTDAEGKAQIKWTTASEINNDHFEVLRSTNGQSWQAIASVKAKGNNSSVQNSYEFTDNTPLNGDSYYRLKQMDRDGRTALSEVKSFSLQGLKNAAASVYPNPTAAAINLMLANYTGNVTATITTPQGTAIYRQVIAATASASAYRLNLTQKLPAGIYFVNLSGYNLSQKLTVIVQ